MKTTPKRLKPVSIKVRISPALHKKLKRDAKQHNKSLNGTMAHLLEEPFKSRIPTNFANDRTCGPKWQRSNLLDALKLELAASRYFTK